MEHPNSVTRPFFGIIAACCVFVVGCSIYFHDLQVLLWGFGLLLAAALGWGLVALLNFIVFPPLFRLVGRLKPIRTGLFWASVMFMGFCWVLLSLYLGLVWHERWDQRARSFPYGLVGLCALAWGLIPVQLWRYVRQRRQKHGR